MRSFIIFVSFSLAFIAVVSAADYNIVNGLMQNYNRMKKLLESESKKFHDKTDQGLFMRLKFLTRYLDQLMAELQSASSKSLSDDNVRQKYQSLTEELLLLENMIEFELKFNENRHNAYKNDDDRFLIAQSLLSDYKLYKNHYDYDLKHYGNDNPEMMKAVNQTMKVTNDMAAHINMFMKMKHFTIHELYQLHQLVLENLMIQNRLLNDLFALERNHKYDHDYDATKISILKKNGILKYLKFKLNEI